MTISICTIVSWKKLAVVIGPLIEAPDGTGAVTLARRYDPFGNALSSVGSGLLASRQMRPDFRSWVGRTFSHSPVPNDLSVES